MKIKIVLLGFLFFLTNLVGATTSYKFDMVLKYQDNSSPTTYSLMINTENTSYAILELDYGGSYSYYLMDENNIYAGQINLKKEFIFSENQDNIAQLYYTPTWVNLNKPQQLFNQKLDNYGSNNGEEIITMSINSSSSIDLYNHLTNIPYLFKIFRSDSPSIPHGLPYLIALYNSNSLTPLYNLAFIESSSIDQTITISQDFPEVNVESVSSPVTYVEMNSNEDVFSDIIQKYLEAENNRNIKHIMSYYKNPLERYWDLKNPTQAQVIESYQSVWKEIPYSHSELVSINILNDSLCYATINFTWSTKSGVVKQKVSNIYFLIDDNQKIVSVYP